MLKQRILTALVLLPLGVGVVVFMSTPWLALVMAGIVCIGAWEWVQIAGLGKLYGRVFLPLIVVSLIAGFMAQNSPWARLIIILGTVWWLIALVLIVLVQRRVLEFTPSKLFKIVIGWLVLVPSWLAMVLLHAGGDYGSRFLLLTLFVIIWSADIAAYFCGKRWGKSPLSGHISPGKTREGVYAGLLAGMVIALVFSRVTDMQAVETAVFILIGAVTVLASIVGDLLESLMKRSVNLKDSGSLLPGHGGVLDRIDSLTAAAPVFLTGIWLSGWQA